MPHINSPVVIDKIDAPITAANTAMDGTGTVGVVLKSQEEPVYVEQIVFRAAGSNIANVARLWLNNGDPHETATNNVPLTEKALAATTASADSETGEEKVIVKTWIPAGWRILITLGSAAAAGWHAYATAGPYNEEVVL